jgi:hypothetical protein
VPTSTPQKADKIERHKRYKAKLAARESSQVVAFDAQAQATSKLRLAVFWREHGARFSSNGGERTPTPQKAVGAAKVEILMADLRGGQVARLLTAGDQPYSEAH